MDVARPALLAKWAKRDNPQHHFLFMDANGRPFGDPLERENGKVRNQRLIQARKGKLMAMFSDFRVDAMIAAGKRVVEAHGNNASHGDRGRMSNIGANLAGVGEERTGRFLGHLVKSTGGRVSTVARSYSRANLEANRETLHDILMSRAWYAERHGLHRLPAPVAPAPAADLATTTKMSPGLAQELKALAADFKAGVYSHDEFTGLKAEAYQRHVYAPLHDTSAAGSLPVSERKKPSTAGRDGRIGQTGAGATSDDCDVHRAGLATIGVEVSRAVGAGTE